MEQESIGPNLKKALTTRNACLKLIWIWLSWALILEKAKTKPYPSCSYIVGVTHQDKVFPISRVGSGFTE